MDSQLDTPRRHDRRIAALLFVTVLGVYGYFYGGTGWNQNASFALTRAIVEQGTIRIDSYAGLTEDVARVGGHLYSNKMPGVSFLCVPLYLPLYQAERALGVDPGRPFVFARNQYLCGAIVNGFLGGAIGALLFLLGVELGVSRRGAVAVALVTALCTPLLPYGTVLFVHVANGAFLLFAYWFARRGGVGDAAWAGFFAGWAVLTNYLTLPAVGFLFLFLAWNEPRSRRWKSAAAFVAGALPPLAAAAWYQFASLGGIFRNPITKNEIFVTHKALFGIFELPSWEAFVGITMSPYRGLFFLSPVLLLSIAGFALWWRTGKERPTLLLIVATTALFVGFNVTFNGWRGGNGIGPRYLVPLVPLLSILLFAVIDRFRPLWLLLAAVSFANSFAATAVNPQPYEQVMDPLRDHIYPQLLTGVPDLAAQPWLAPGRTSVNIDSFNLGELLAGSGSAWSLVPVLVWITAMALIAARLARKADLRSAESYR